MATITTPSGQSFTVPDETLESHIENGFLDPSAAPAASYAEMKVGALRELARERGLATSGAKPELIELLELDDVPAPSDEQPAE